MSAPLPFNQVCKASIQKEEYIVVYFLLFSWDYSTGPSDKAISKVKVFNLVGFRSMLLPPKIKLLCCLTEQEHLICLIITKKKTTEKQEGKCPVLFSS